MILDIHFLEITKGQTVTLNGTDQSTQQIIYGSQLQSPVVLQNLNFDNDLVQLSTQNIAQASHIELKHFYYTDLETRD